MRYAILAAVGRRKMEEINIITRKHPLVVFGSMDGRSLEGIKSILNTDERPGTIPVYLYETG